MTVVYHTGPSEPTERIAAATSTKRTRTEEDVRRATNGGSIAEVKARHADLQKAQARFAEALWKVLES